MYDLIQQFYKITHKPKKAAVFWYSEVYDEMEECLIEVMGRIPQEINNAAKILLEIQELYQDKSIRPEDLIHYLETYRVYFTKCIRWLTKK